MQDGHRLREPPDDVDVVLDAIGGETQERSWEVLKPGGRLVSILQPPNQEKAKAHGVTAMVFLMQRSAQQLGDIAKLLEDGTIKAITTHEFPHIGHADLLECPEEAVEIVASFFGAALAEDAKAR